MNGTYDEDLSGIDAGWGCGHIKWGRRADWHWRVQNEKFLRRERPSWNWQQTLIVCICVCVCWEHAKLGGEGCWKMQYPLFCSTLLHRPKLLLPICIKLYTYTCKDGLSTFIFKKTFSGMRKGKSSTHAVPVFWKDF